MYTIVYCFIVFELLLPTVNKKFTRDLFDLGAYAVGALFFHLIINKSKPNSAIN